MESQATRALRQRQGLGDPTLVLHRSGAMTFPVSPAPLANTWPGYRITPTAVVLIAANLVPLAGVLFFGWSVFATLLLGGERDRRRLQHPAHVVHGIFVLQLFGGIHTRGFPTAAMFWDAVRGAGIAPAAWGLALSHAVSFAFNYIGAGQYRTAPLPMLVGRPYGSDALRYFPAPMQLNPNETAGESAKRAEEQTD